MRPDLIAVKAWRAIPAEKLCIQTGVRTMFLYIPLVAAAVFASVIGFVFVEDALRFKD